MTTDEITKHYGITRQTIRNWEKYKGLKTKRTASRRLIWDSESIEWLQDFIEKNTEFKDNSGDDERFEIQNRRYLGAKGRLLGFISKIVKDNTKGVHSVADIFAGTGSVANLFFKDGKSVIVNDILDSNLIIYNTFFGTDTVNNDLLKQKLHEMNNIELKENYVSLNYGGKYFSMDNAKKIGEAREYIEHLTDINEREKSILITSLIYAMDKVANTVGHYDAYRRIMDSLNPIKFRMPDYNVSSNRSTIFHEDANELVKKIYADLVYIDTPYNSRQYGDVYHVLENITDWKKPKLYGVAMKPKDRSKTKSLYSTSKAPEAFDNLISNINSKYILVSYNNMAKKGSGRSNAKISNEEIIDILSKRGQVKVFSEDFQVFNTGKTNIKGHKEILYLVEVEK
ncbi:MAG: DNA adenine methylase [Staphylococcus epidermidis]|nr:DNA adenine methylase [Staphylococcus epidermidis]